MKKHSLNVENQNRFIIVFLILIFVIYAFISVMLHLKYQTFGWDLGFFDQLVWKLSRGIFPLSSLNRVNILANHFSPVLFLLVPLYWIRSDPSMLLIFQSFIMVSAGWPLFLLARKKTTSFWFAFATIFAYLFFIGTQWSILNEYHEATFAPLFISLVFYGLETNLNFFWVGIIGLFGTKEEFSLLLAAVGIMVWWQFKKPKLGIAITLTALIMFFVLTEIFMPAISEKGVYQHLHISSQAKSPAEFLKLAIIDPGFILSSLITPIQKLHTFIWSLLAFGLLTIFTPIGMLLPLIEQFLMRFIYTGPQFTVWQNVNHHAAPTAILLAISAIYAGPKLVKILGNRSNLKETKIYFYLAFWLVLTTIIQDVYFKAPVHSLVKKNFYKIESFVSDNNEMLKQIPNTSVVAAQNSLVPHLSQRETFYLLPETGMAEYIAVDLHDGPNKYAPVSKNEIQELVNEATVSGAYRIEYKQNEAILLKRNI